MTKQCKDSQDSSHRKTKSSSYTQVLQISWCISSLRYMHAREKAKSDLNCTNKAVGMQSFDLEEPVYYISFS